MTNIIQTIGQSEISSNATSTNSSSSSAANTSLTNTTTLPTNTTNSNISTSTIVQVNTISANNHHQTNNSVNSGTAGGGSVSGNGGGGGGNQETCLICGDVASGKHYGLRSCEACKAFFKRTVQGKIEYSCPATRECEINKRRRKACQACRFQKCLNMGMLKEGVRLDRVRGGRQKYRRGTSPSPGSTSMGGASCLSTSSLNNTNNNSSSTSAMGHNNSSNTNNSLNINGNQANSSSLLLSSSSSAPLAGVAGGSNHLSFPLANTTTIAATHQQTAIGSGETSKIMTALINCEPEELSASPAQYVSNIPTNLNVQLKTLYILGDLFDRELVSLIGWAKQIPGFSETITLNDQMRLLQSTWAEVIALSIGYRSHLKRIEIYKQQQLGIGSGTNNSGLGIHNFMNATTPSPTSSSPASTSSSSYNNGTSNTLYNLENTEVRLVFAKDLIMDFKHAILCGAEEIFYNCVQLIKRLDHLKITPKEFILLKAISLTNADVRLENPKATFRLRDLVMDALYEVTLTEYLNSSAGSLSQNDFSSSIASIKHEISNNNGRSGGSSSSACLQQFKVEAQERPPSSMNQYASSTSSPTPPSRSSSSVPSSSSTSSISTHSHNSSNNNNNINSNNNIINASTATSLDLGNKKTIINNRMNQVLLCLPVLRQIDSSIRKFWNDIRKGPNNVPMNKLFEEMLEPCQRMYRSSVEM